MRRLFKLASLFLWMIVLAISLELFGYITEAFILKFNINYKTPDEVGAEDRVINAYSSFPLHDTLTQIPCMSNFAFLDEAARASYVTLRHEAVFICDRYGTIKKIYASKVPKEIAELAHIGQTGATIGSIAVLPNGTTPATFAKSAVETGSFKADYFPVRLSDGKDCPFQFNFLPLRCSDGAVEETAVIVRPPVWEIPWYRFRKDIDFMLPIGEGVWEVTTAQFHSNNYGFRDDDFIVPKPQGVYRIVCVGGSTTVEGLTNELTYPRLLQRKLRAKFQTAKIDVFNCGIYNIVSEKELERFPDFLALQPDMIIYYNYVNDVRQSIHKWIQTDHSSNWAKSCKLALRKSKFFYWYLNGFLLPSRQELIGTLNAQILDNLRHMAREARSKGVDFCACSFAYPQFTISHPRDRCFMAANMMHWINQLTLPSYQYITCLYNSLLRDMCQKEGIHYIPVAEGITGSSRYFDDMCHLNPVGIELKADIILAKIENQVASRRTK